MRRLSAPGERFRRIDARSIAAGLLLAVPVSACAPVAPAPLTPGNQVSTPTTAAAPAAQPAAKPTSQPTRVRAGMLRILNDAPEVLAFERGYFAEAGITLDLQEFDSIATMVPLLGTGQLDVAFDGASSAGLFNALARGVNLKLVANQGVAAPGHSVNAIVAAKSLLDSGQVKRLSDLRGRHVNVLLEGVFAQLMVDKALASDGLSLADVQQEKLSFPDTVAALKSGALDGSFLVEPFITLGKDQGILGVLVPGEQLYPNHEIVEVVYAQQFADQDQLASAFMVAYLRGVRDYLQAFFTPGGDRASAEAQLIKDLTVKDPALYERMGLPYVNPNGYINLADLTQQQSWYVDQHLVQQPAPLEQWVDSRFVDRALATLGQYSP